jgi:hypothetical protein
MLKTTENLLIGEDCKPPKKERVEHSVPPLTSSQVPQSTRKQVLIT